MAVSEHRMNKHRRRIEAEVEVMEIIPDGWGVSFTCTAPGCKRDAGQATGHPGIGDCNIHGGNTRAGYAKAGMIMGKTLASQLDITPWEALLGTVRSSAGMAAWYQSKLAEVDPDDVEAVLPGGVAYGFVQGLERMNMATARYSKMAIDAGVAKVLVERVQAQAAQLMPLIAGVLGELENSLDEETMARVRGALRRGLLELDRRGWDTIGGSAALTVGEPSPGAESSL